MHLHADTYNSNGGYVGGGQFTSNLVDNSLSVGFQILQNVASTVDAAILDSTTLSNIAFIKLSTTRYRVLWVSSAPTKNFTPAKIFPNQNWETLFSIPFVQDQETGYVSLDNEPMADASNPVLSGIKVPSSINDISLTFPSDFNTPPVVNSFSTPIDVYYNVAYTLNSPSNFGKIYQGTPNQACTRNNYSSPHYYMDTKITMSSVINNASQLPRSISVYVPLNSSNWVAEMATGATSGYGYATTSH